MIAIVVLICAGAWVATGEFSFVGSALGEDASAAEAPQENMPEVFATPTGSALKTVAYTVVHQTEYYRQLRISGRTEADKQAVVAARSSGVIDRLPAAKGATVEKGDLLMGLDGPEKYTAIDAAEALVKQREHLAEVNAELLQRGKITSLVADESQSALSAARSSLEAARAEVDRLELRAPFAGIVDDVMVEEGAWVTSGTPVASLLSLDPIVAVGEVSERDLRDLAKGNKALVRFGDGSEARGEIRYIQRAATELTLTFPIEVEVPNLDGSISAGMSAEIVLSAQPVTSVTVPRSVITLGPGNVVGVRTLKDGDIVAFLPVTIADDSADGLIVTGIPEGTKVIVSGQDLVTAGDTVHAVAAGAGSNG